MSFKWKDRYLLGIEEIDNQHRKLFEIGRKAYDIAVLNDSYDHYDEIMEIIDELLNYAEYHFKYEENLINSYNFDGLGQQRQEHEFYVKRIKDILSKDIDSDQQQATLEIVDFLSEWISNHILFSDRKYAIYFKEKGIEIK